MDTRQWHETVTAAQAGDRQALDELVAGWLPLVYNVVGRALNGHADVDDVVQETMMRAVRHLDSLRDPDSFRSWLVAIAMRQVREHARRRPGNRELAEHDGTADDFAQLTVLRLHLEGQRREVAEAARWLDDEDRQLLSLWWLEVAGELTRRELAAAVGVSRQHAAVRIQRMKGRLETARGIVRALDSPCGELGRLTGRWDGSTGSVWRKRLARHVRDCARCAGRGAGVVPADRLLVGLALVPVPAGFTLSFVLGGKTAAAAAAPAAWSAKVAGVLTKPVVAAVTAGAVLSAGGVYVAARQSSGPPPRAVRTTAATVPSRLPEPRPTTTAPTVPAPSTAPALRLDLYGTVVDAVDRAPDPNRLPGPLPRRAERGITMTGVPSTGMTHRGEYAAFSGTGYFQVYWQVMPQRPGDVVMPTWTGLKGKLFHVASAGGRRLDDVQPGSTDGTTWMGGPTTGDAVLPAGAQQMWQSEYFWLDGTVTLHQNEHGADYNLFPKVSSWEEVTGDLTTRPDPGAGRVRYGLVRDTGDDTAPVPQYLTRADPADTATVPQRTRITG